MEDLDVNLAYILLPTTKKTLKVKNEQSKKYNRMAWTLMRASSNDYELVYAYIKQRNLSERPFLKA